MCNLFAHAESFNKRDWTLLRIKLRRTSIEEPTGTCYTERNFDMGYDKDKIHRFVEKTIPKGKIMTPSGVAEALGLDSTSYQRCVAQEICKCEKPERYRIVLKSGWKFPHQNDQDNCDKRADFLKGEGISISENNTRVLNAEKFLYKRPRP